MVVEQRIAELKSAALRHLRSGKFKANAAWLALAVMAHNLARAVGRLAGPDLDKATVSTLQRTIFTVPGRLVNSGRRRHLGLPVSPPWASVIAHSLTDASDPTALLTPSPYPYDQDLGEAGQPAAPPRPIPPALLPADSELSSGPHQGGRWIRAKC